MITPGIFRGALGMRLGIGRLFNNYALLSILISCFVSTNAQYDENTTLCVNRLYDELKEYEDGVRALSCQFYNYKKHVVRDALCMCVMHKKSTKPALFTYVRYCDGCSQIYDTRRHVSRLAPATSDTLNGTSAEEYRIYDSNFDLSTWVEIDVYGGIGNNSQRYDDRKKALFPTMAFPNTFISDHFFVDCDCNLKISSDLNLYNFAEEYETAKKSEIYDKINYHKFQRYIIPYEKYEFKYNIVPEHTYDDITPHLSCYYDANTFEDVRYCEFQNYEKDMLNIG